MSDIERKTSIGDVSIKSADKGQARVRFANPDGKTADHDREIIDPNAIRESHVVTSPFGHRSVTEGAIPAGKATVHSDGTADIQFFLDTQIGRETFATVKALGPIVQYSFGFKVREEGKLTDAMRSAGVRRYLKRLDVWEVSPVVRGAALVSGTLDIKCDGCGGKACACDSSKGPSRKELAAIVAKVKRTLADGAELLARTAPRTVSPEEADARLKHARYMLGMVRETQIDRERHAAAVKCAAWVAQCWGVRPAEVKWYSPDAIPATVKDGGGFFHPKVPGVIWVRSDCYGEKLFRVLLHEQSHAARHARGLDNSEAEVDRDVAALTRRYYSEVLHHGG